jgi:EpsI family protein
MQDREIALRNTLASVGLIAAVVLVYWPSTAALWEYWRNDNHSGAHGLLVAPLSVWLLIRARDRLAACRPQPSVLACMALCAASIAWLVFWRAGIQELHLLLFPLLMGLAIVAALGWRAALIVAFPIGYLYFSVPAWGVLGRPLQDLTIWAVGCMAPLIGVPAHIQGDLVILPGVGLIEIASSCSGVNFFTIGLAIAALLGELERASLRRRALLLAVIGALALVANWLRVLIIVDAGYTTQMRHVLVSRSHYMFGWVLFTLVIVTAVWLLARAPDPAARAPSSSKGYFHPTAWSMYVLALIALVTTPLAVYAFVPALDQNARPLVFTAPAGRGSWRGPFSTGTNWKPDFVGPHSQWTFVYQGPQERTVEMVAIGYPVQGQGYELVNEENELFGAAAKLDTVAENTVKLDQQSYIETVVADDHGNRTLVWSVYDIGGRQFARPLLSQLWYGVRSLGGPPYSILFAFRASCTASCGGAREMLQSFARSMTAPLFQSVTRAPAALAARSRVDG